MDTEEEEEGKRCPGCLLLAADNYSLRCPVCGWIHAGSYHVIGHLRSELLRLEREVAKWKDAAKRPGCSCTERSAERPPDHGASSG